MLEFVIPIFYPVETSRVTVMVGNIVFGAYMGERKLDWALVMRDTVERLLTGIGKSKSIPICPYLLHLYIAHDTIQPDDKKIYMVEESFMLHDIELEENDQSTGSKSLERESLRSREIRELQGQEQKKQASPPRCKVTPTCGRKDKVHQIEKRVEALKRGNPFTMVTEALNEI